MTEDDMTTSVEPMSGWRPDYAPPVLRRHRERTARLRRLCQTCVDAFADAETFPHCRGCRGGDRDDSRDRQFLSGDLADVLRELGLA
jgi:hypothetical protein